MLAGHYATALVAKQSAPRGTLAYYLVAAQLPDLLWLVFHYLGLEPTLPEDVLDVSLPGLMVDMVYSHDLIPIAFWIAVTAAAGYGLYRDRRVAAAGAVLVVLHAATDYLAGYPHHVFGADTPSVGTGLYYSAPYVAVAFEAIYTIGFVAWFFRGERRAKVVRPKAQRYTIIGVFAFGIVFMASVASSSHRELFGVPPMDVPFNTTIPAMLITYTSLIAVLLWAARSD